MKKILIAALLALCFGTAAGSLWAADLHATRYSELREKTYSIDWQCDKCSRSAYQLDMENLSELCKEHAGK